MWQELRVLLQGVQALTGFLIILPFYQGFKALSAAQHAVYLDTFGCTLASLSSFARPPPSADSSGRCVTAQTSKRSRRA
jgi:hypothetical protein